MYLSIYLPICLSIQLYLSIAYLHKSILSVYEYAYTHLKQPISFLNAIRKKHTVSFTPILQRADESFKVIFTIEALCVHYSLSRNHGFIYEAVPLPLNVFIESMANTNNAIIATLSLDPSSHTTSCICQLRSQPIFHVLPRRGSFNASKESSPFELMKSYTENRISARFYNQYFILNSVTAFNFNLRQEINYCSVLFTLFSQNESDIRLLLGWRGFHGVF